MRYLKRAASAAACIACSAGSALATPIVPEPQEEISGNSFTQGFLFTVAGVSTLKFSFVDNVAPNPGNIWLDNVAFGPFSGWGGANSGNNNADQVGSQFVGSGPSNSTFGVFLTFDGTNANHGNAIWSSQQTFTWRVIGFDSDGEAVAGLEWSNSGDPTYEIPGFPLSFGGKFRHLSEGELAQSVLIPLPGAAGMALAGMGLIGIRRRR